MLKYTAKRILTFIPMLIAISLLSFIISINAPGDPVERLSKAAGNEGSVEQQSGASKKIKEELRRKLGLDLPIFYFSIGDIASSDTLYKVQDKYHQANLKVLTHQCGNWEVVSEYYHALLKLQKAHQKLNTKDIWKRDTTKSINAINETSNQFGFEIGSLLETSKSDILDFKFNKMASLIQENDFLNQISNQFYSVGNSREKLISESTKWKNYIPSAKWYGGNNQYHLWLFGNMSYYPFKTIIKFKSIFKTKSEIPQVFAEMCKSRSADNHKEYLNSGDYTHFNNVCSELAKFSNDTTGISSSRLLRTFDANSYESADSLYTAIYNQNINQIENLINTIKHPDGSIERNRRKGLLRGDFGISYIDGQPISTKIWQKVWISFSLSIMSIILAYLISIPIGIFSAYKKDSAIDRGTSLVLFTLYSMPSFFIGTLLLLYFANPDNLSWFPVSGIQDPTSFDPDWSFWMKTKHRMPYLILPIITYTYGSFAFLSRIMRIGMIEVVSQDYIRTARAKGLGERKVILKHALRNSLLPILTVFASIFPVAIGGSVIIEVIFSIPGMGVEVYNSILNYDYPMIITVFTITGFLTMLGYLIVDILYAIVDPRISYS